MRLTNSRKQTKYFAEVQEIAMRKNILKVLKAPWYFIPLAAFPVLALLSYNI